MGTLLLSTDVDPAIGLLKSESLVSVDHHATVNHLTCPAFFASQTQVTCLVGVITRVVESASLLVGTSLFL